MPSATSLFFAKRRETAEDLPHDPLGVTVLGKEPKSRNKLRKLPPVRPSERARIDFGELFAGMGNRASRYDNVPRPTRPPRPLASELPDLPGLPIYKAIGAARHIPATVLACELDNEKQTSKKPEPPSRRPSIANRRPSIAGTKWPLTDTEAETAPRGRPASRTARTTPRKLYSCSADAAFFEKQRPPMYDRASHLAESYRALLPSRGDVDGDSDYDISSAASEEATNLESLPAPTPSHMQKWSWDPREPFSLKSQTPRSLSHFGNRSIFGRPDSSAGKTQGNTLSAPRVPSWISPTARAPSTGSCSSFTAVESYHSDSLGEPLTYAHASANVFRPSESITPISQTASHLDETETPWSPNIDYFHQEYYPQHQSHQSYSYNDADQHHSTLYTATDEYSHDPHMHRPIPPAHAHAHLTSHSYHPYSEPHPYQPQRPLSTHSHNRRPLPRGSQSRSQNRRTSDDLGLQICGEMLSDQLRKTFLGANLKDGRESGKLQILLLIEAYEATLESCRCEVARPPLTRGGEAEGVRKHHARQLVGILDHWLGVLYRIYDDDFGDGDIRRDALGGSGCGDMF